MQGDNKGFLVCKKKMATSADLLCRYTPPAFRQFTEAVVNLKFDEEPRYSAYVPLFEPLCGPGPQRPILLEEKTLRVGQKRGREAFEGEDVEIVSLLLMPVFIAVPSVLSRLLCFWRLHHRYVQGAKETIRLGLPATQHIVIYRHIAT